MQEISSYSPYHQGHGLSFFSLMMTNKALNYPGIVKVNAAGHLLKPARGIQTIAHRSMREADSGQVDLINQFRSSLIRSDMVELKSKKEPIS